MKLNLLLGTYTRRVSEGIYRITLDTEAATLSDLKLLTKENSPTYLTRSQAGNVYTVTAVDGAGGAGAYNQDFSFLNAVTEEGAPLCYVAVDETRQLVYGANYHKGRVNVYKILADGSLVPADAITHDEATGPHENQNTPHVHYTDLTPDNRLAVCDLGTDIVYTYDVADNGKLTEVAQFHVEAGTGPRHLAFHPNQKVAYLFGELDNTITVLSYNQADGSFTALQKIATLPADFTEFNGGAAVRISNDGKFLYASNRGHDSIVVYGVNPDGTELTLVQHISTEGKFPRDFALDPSNQFLIAANQDSDNLTLYRRNAENGKLTLIEKDIFAPECVCVFFDK
ncbi:6-phosphogluconolactonase [Enterococcus sp. PF1-24]|uniref:lactonase family protein n=1 Tax=unclassified Enterococcus TaxID=2608891 RepID=UPI00247588D7|nr:MULTISPECIES: lactonase family protein [unclassified Enterococcus]MDH6365736.1 6-phosphogluconolactonase [Enterococcus sp. PFB1-1]MDH6402841.1 6-phosphogluconolactonase [Enterococcus sp. PF1-24]